MAARRFRELGRSEDLAYELVFAALGGGIVGAKLYWAVENGELSLSGLFSGSGLTWYGGLFGGAIAGIAGAEGRGVFTLRAPHLPGMGAPAGDAVGRVGWSDHGHRRLLE